MLSYLCIAQEPISIHLIEKDGLPDIEFYDIIEDKEGFIWLAADKGLYRYDGKNFKKHTHIDKRGLSVFGLKLGPKGRVWCNNISGQYFYVENDELQLFTDLNKYTKGDLASFILLKQNLIVGSYPNLLKVNYNTKLISQSENGVYSYVYAKRDTLFFTDKNQIKYKLGEGKELHKFDLNITDSAYGTKWNHSIFKNKLLFYTYDYKAEVSKFFYEDNNSLEQVLLNEQVLNQRISNFYTENNTIWFCTQTGIYIYKYINGVFTYQKNYFKGENITKVIKDRNNNYWITTLKNGVFIIPNIAIKKYLIEEKNINVLEKLDAEKIILGSKKGKITIIDTKNSIEKIVSIEGKQKIAAIAKNTVSDIYVSSENKSFVLDKESYKIKKQKLPNFDNAKEISVVNNSKIIYSAHNFTSVIDKEQETSHILGLRRSYTNYYSKKNDEIYVGYVDGLEYYENDYVTHKITLNNKPIFAVDIAETNNDIIWIATFKNGVLGIKDGNVAYSYSTENGLLSNQTSILKSDGDKLWIVTSIGIQLLNTNTQKLQSITKKDGLNSFRVSDMAILNSKVYFASNDGVFEINKKEAFKEFTLPEIYFTKVSIEDREVALKSNYSLPIDANKIKFQFHVNGYLSEENITYQYRLVGAHDSWSKVTKGINEVIFNSLSAGNYTFQLKAVENGSLNETTIEAVQIKIKLPFYREWWFIASVFLVSLFLIWRYFLWRIRSLKEKQKENLEKERINKRLIASQLESLRSQMNPHFIFNALNSIQEYIVLNEKHLASAFLVKFSRLIRMYLEHSQEHYISLTEELKALKLYLQLEKDRFEDTLEYTVSVSESIVTNNIKVPSIFIQPYVENAIKHGLLHKTSNRKLKVSFVLKNEHLICSIQDNGIGRIASEKIKQDSAMYHKSYATKANQKRIDLINVDRIQKISVITNDLYDNNQKPTGTTVIINIPL